MRLSGGESPLKKHCSHGLGSFISINTSLIACWVFMQALFARFK
jgi:hypothetical protein